MQKEGLTRRESAAGSGLPDPAHRHSGLPHILPAPLQDDDNLKQLLSSLSEGQQGLRLLSSPRSSRALFTRLPVLWEHCKHAATEGLGAGCKRHTTTPCPQLRSSLPDVTVSMRPALIMPFRLHHKRSYPGQQKCLALTGSLSPSPLPLTDVSQASRTVAGAQEVWWSDTPPTSTSLTPHLKR